LAIVVGALCFATLLTWPGATMAQPAADPTADRHATGKRATADIEGIRMSEAAFAPQHTDTATTTVTCLGDSITAGFPYVGSDQTYPARLTSLLDFAYGDGAYRVVNRGVTGYRADQVLDDLRTYGWMAQDNPDAVLLMVGGNDLMWEIVTSGSNRDIVIARTATEVQAIIDEVVAHANPQGGYPRVIVSAFPPNLLIGTYGSQTVALYNERLQTDLTNYSMWIDTNWSDLYDTALGMAQDDLMSDPVHPNSDGYAIVAQNWFDALAQLGRLTPRVYLPAVVKST
jgi:lysophospholipase L1-like esterase